MIDFLSFVIINGTCFGIFCLCLDIYDMLKDD